MAGEPMSGANSRRPVEESTAAQDFLSGGGEMGALMRSHDWAQSSVGPPSHWPQSLRSAVSILLPSRAQICLFWGPDLIAIYNDAYRPTLGRKHPWALGRPAREVWREFWDDVLRPLLEKVLNTGAAFWANDYPFFLQRYGYPEETYFDISYDPVRDESGGVGGVFCIVSETTGRVVGERRLRTLRDVSRIGADAEDMDDAFRKVAAVLAQNPLDLPFVHFCQQTSPETVRCIAASGIEEVPADLWPIAEAAATRREVITDAAHLKGAVLNAGPWPEAIRTVVTLPIVGTGQAPLGYLVAGVSPRRAFDDSYLDFLRLIASNTASSAGAAQALAEERARAKALAELDRAKTLFFSNISHEFRTPLTLMLGPIEEVIANPQSEIAEGDRTKLELAHRNALRLLKLTNGLLDFSRIEAGRVRAAYQPTDLAEYTAELASNFRSATNSAGLALVVDCPPLPYPVYVDRDMWEKIVLNLISNAFKFTFEGRITVRLRSGDNSAELTVSDTGTGIPEAEIPRIFERFHRVEGARGRTFEGTGIGLALVQELVKLHGGTISVTSAEDKGTAFTIAIPFGSAHLPADRVVTESEGRAASGRARAYVEEALRWLPDAADAQSAAETASPFSAPIGDAPAVAGRRVLLADDNADMRSYVRRLLGAQGYEIEAVPDGESALTAARKRTPDLVLADVMMPNVDGFELLKRLRADPKTATVPIVLLSARAGEESKVEGLAAGADDYLVKPFSARELFARIGSAIALSEARRATAKALREENERVRRLFQQAPGFIAILEGPEHRFTFANDAYRRYAGGRELVGRTVREAFPEVEGQGFFEILDRAYRTGERFVGEKMALTLTIEGTERKTFINFIYEPAIDAAGNVTGIFVEGHDVTAQQHYEDHLRLLINELNHRVKNTLTTVQSLAARSFTGAMDVDAAREAFEARVIALSAAHDVLTAENWTGADVARVLRETLRPFAGRASNRLHLDGPAAWLPSTAVPAFSMAINELATNAVKYGAWSTGEGRVDIAWSVDRSTDPAQLSMRWSESDGPRVEMPKRRGFGSRLIDRALAYDLGGKAEIAFEASGVVCTMTMSLGEKRSPVDGEPLAAHQRTPRGTGEAASAPPPSA